ncbi:MAG: hypothetical protein M3134_04485, partial [Actinomycetota bacterium]|nr:hypothetical protein [Actinomycetota bacterium]
MSDARSSVTYSYEGPEMREHVAALAERKAKHLGMGGPERIQRQHDAGKLTARERLDLLFDEGTFLEHGLLAHHQSTSPAMQG